MNLEFHRLEYLFLVLPFLLLCFLRWRTRAFVGHSLVHRFKSLPVRTAWWVRLPRTITIVALILVWLTLLDPVLTLSRVRVITRGLDVVLLVDLSSSMFEYMTSSSYEVPGQAGHLPQTKLEVVKDAVSEFVQARQGDRVGTLVFSERAYVVNPLTLDYQYVVDYLDVVDYRTLAGEGRTAIGEAIFSGFRLLRWKDPERQFPAVIMILTDGENNAGRDIYEALERAHQEKVRVYMIGLQVWYLGDSEKLQQALASTGGRFFDVQESEQLQEAYQIIDALERQQLVTERYVRDAPYYYPFAAGALLLLVLASLLRALPRFIQIC